MSPLKAACGHWGDQDLTGKLEMQFKWNRDKYFDISFQAILGTINKEIVVCSDAGTIALDFCIYSKQISSVAQMATWQWMHGNLLITQFFRIKRSARHALLFFAPVTIDNDCVPTETSRQTRRTIELNILWKVSGVSVIRFYDSRYRYREIIYGSLFSINSRAKKFRTCAGFRFVYDRTTSFSLILI